MPLPILAFVLLARQDAFPNTPAHRWAFEAVAFAKREGLFVDYPDDGLMRRGRPARRYEMAVVFHALVTNQLRQAESFSERPGDEIARTSLLRSAALFPVYHRAEREFRRELTALGVEGDFGQARLAALTRQIDATSPARDRLFRDVPADHWAAKAVGDLRALGLLDGYPEGLFRG